MPTIDLNAIVGPIIRDVVAPLVFPSVVTFEMPTEDVDPDSGAPVPDWEAIADLTDLPAVIEPMLPSRGGDDRQTGQAQVTVDTVTILLAGDFDVPLAARCVVQGTPDVWFVSGVALDVARVTTTVTGTRYRNPDATGPLEPS